MIKVGKTRQWLESLKLRLDEAIIDVEIDIQNKSICRCYAIDFHEIYNYAFPPIEEMLRVLQLRHGSRKNQINNEPSDELINFLPDLEVLRHHGHLAYLFEESAGIGFALVPPYPQEMEMTLSGIRQKALKDVYAGLLADFDENVSDLIADKKVTKISQKYRQHGKLSKKDFTLVKTLIEDKYIALRALFSLNRIMGVKTIRRLQGNVLFEPSQKTEWKPIISALSNNYIEQKALQYQVPKLRELRPAYSREWNNYVDAVGIQWICDFNDEASLQYEQGSTRDQVVIRLV